jgi:hypothetical protein
MYFKYCIMSVIELYCINIISVRWIVVFLVDKLVKKLFCTETQQCCLKP